jgi:16S rRNA (cytosine967-C5)-methyltransferase
MAPPGNSTTSHPVRTGDSGPRLEALVAPHGGIALWQQLNATAAVLIAVRKGKSWTSSQLSVEVPLRPGVQALSFAVMRQYGTALALRTLLAARTPAVAVDALLCTVLALSLETDTEADATVNGFHGSGGIRYAAHTLVSQAVEAAKRNPATKAQASFINACLRQFMRERVALLAQAMRQPQSEWNHPAWWIQRLQNEYPHQWQAMLRANAFAAPLTLRVNTQQTNRVEYRLALEAIHLKAHDVAQSGLQLAQSTYVPGLPGYVQGWFSVQDAAAQLAAPLLLDAVSLDPESTDSKDNQEQRTPHRLRVLDACAAPGGKTAHLLEYAALKGLQIDVLAIDIDETRCQRIQDNLLRLQLSAHVQVADATHPQVWWDGKPFDAILLDAPCTASGIVRRHPDIRWLRRAADVDQLAAQQKTLLQALWPLLKPGAPLLYCTCSVFKAEGQDQIQTFLAHNTDAVLLPSPGHLLPQSAPQLQGLRDNHLGGHDGFFYALLQKSSSLA